MRQQPWVSIAPGALRHLVQIQTQGSDQDDFGQMQPNWTTVRECWAAIASVTQDETFSAEQTTAQVTCLIFMRWTSTVIQKGMRVVRGSHTYLIQTVEDIMLRHRYIRLLCLELNATS